MTTIALLGPRCDVDSWDIYRALELLGQVMEYDKIVALDRPNNLGETVKEFGWVYDIEAKVFPVLECKHGGGAHVTALWDILKCKPDLFIFFGPADIQVQNAMTMIRYYNHRHWEPFGL